MNLRMPLITWFNVAIPSSWHWMRTGNGGIDGALEDTIWYGDLDDGVILVDTLDDANRWSRRQHVGGVVRVAIH